MKKLLIFICVSLAVTLVLFAENVIDFSEWEGNFSVLGENSFDSFGHSSSSGDFNGDGIEDLVVGAPFSDPEGRGAAGSIYIFFGSVAHTQEELTDLSFQNADVTIIGAEENHQLGKTLIVGNFNNDMFDDILVAAPFADVADIEAAGKVFLILGQQTFSSNYDLNTGGFQSVFLGEAANDNLGLSLAAGNVNNDTFEDVVIGTPYADHNEDLNCGKAYVIYGQLLLSTEYDLANSAADVMIFGSATNDKAAFSAVCSDVNNDNIDDLLLGAPALNPGNISEAGCIYLIEGQDNLSEEIDLETSADVSARILGTAENSNIGKAIAAGKISIDNNEDIIFTDFISNSVKVVFGSEEISGDIQTADIEISGGDFGGTPGYTLFCEQINETDFSESIIIGIPDASTSSGNNSGALYVLKGPDLPASIDLDTYTDYTLYIGEAADAKLGISFTALSINGDPRTDVCIGSSEGANSTGSMRSVYGDLPYITEKNPDDDAQNVAADTSVSFSVWDDEDGINIESVIVQIAGSQYLHSDIPNFSYQNLPGNGYRITIVPYTNFGYNQEVDVTIDAEDNASWIMPTDSYRFYTRADTDPPYVINESPEPDETGLPVSTNISFDILDAGEGVNLSSIVVTVEGTNYYNGVDGFSYSELSENNYEVNIDPPENFEFNQVVDVSINASDLADPANIMPAYEYSFTCGQDDEPPEVVIWDPENGGEVPYNYILHVKIRDLGTGLNENTVHFYLDDIDVTDDAIHTTVTSEDDWTSCDVYYDPSPNEFYTVDHTYDMRIVAEDNASPLPNTFDFTSSFTCVEDNEMPVTSGHIPARNSTENPSNIIFGVDITDNMTGVDESSIHIIIDGQDFANYDIMNDATITAVFQGYRIRYSLPGVQRWHGEYDVSIDASDLNDPPNVMPTDNYVFSCSEDNQPPYLADLDPEENAVGVNIDTEISFKILDDKTGVDLESIQIFVGAVNITDDCNIGNLNNGYSVSYNPPEDFAYSQQVSLMVQASDNAETPNDLIYNYSFFTEDDATPPFVQNADPYDGQEFVPLNTNIFLEIADAGSGVDQNTIYLEINSVPVQPVITALDTENGFSLFFDPEDFGYQEDVLILVQASDNALGTPNEMIYEYSFSVVDDDETAPFVRGRNPSPNANDVPVSTAISFEILDAETGVDQSSIIFRLNNENITDYSLEAVSYYDTTGFYLQYIPAAEFEYGEVVYVQLYARDNSSNMNEVMDNYTFICELDISVPIILNAFPQDNGIGYPLTKFSYEITDEKSGLDPSTLVFIVDGVELLPDIAEFTDGILLIAYQPSAEMSIDDLISVSIQITDVSGNIMDETLMFTVVNIQPNIVSIFPEPNGEGFPNSVLYYSFRDTIAVIDTTSFELMIKQASETNYSVLTPDNVILNTETNETGFLYCDFEVFYDPLTVDEYNYFEIGTTEISITFKNEVGCFLSTSYSFEIIPDDFDPYFIPISPEENSADFVAGDPLILDILDKGMGIDQSSLKFSVNGSEINSTNYNLTPNPIGLNPDSLGFRLNYTLSAAHFYEGQQVSIHIYAEDLVSNFLDEGYSFYLERESVNMIDVVPSTITLNNDGYNEECRIIIETTEDKSNIVGKIYNRRGKTIRILNIEKDDPDTKYAVWDGRDKDSNFIPGGIYIYQIKINNKTYQGTIVVAK